MKNAEMIATTAPLMLEDFVLEELETRLEMAWCCTNCSCSATDWKGSCIEQICKSCRTC